MWSRCKYHPGENLRSLSFVGDERNVITFTYLHIIIIIIIIIIIVSYAEYLVTYLNEIPSKVLLLLLLLLGPG
jgi:hypothetical protein